IMRGRIITNPPRSAVTWSRSYFSEDVLRQQLLDVHRRLHLGDAAVALDGLLRPAGIDPDVLFPDEPARLDGRDRVFLQLDAGLDAHVHARLIVRERDAVHAPDLHPRDLHRGARLEPAHGGEIRGDGVAGAAEELDPAELDG